MTVYLCCQYCDKRWTEIVYSEFSLVDKRCIVCKDKRIKVQRSDSSKIDYYKGSPSFKETPTPADWSWDQGGID